MSDVQRWDGMKGYVMAMTVNDEGRYVTYADHVAAVAAAEQRGREKCHDWRLHTAELERLLNAEGAAAHAAGVAQGVKAARDAVDGTLDVPHRSVEYVDAIVDAVDAIDALLKEKP